MENLNFESQESRITKEQVIESLRADKNNFELLGKYQDQCYENAKTDDEQLALNVEIADIYITAGVEKEYIISALEDALNQAMQLEKDGIVSMLEQRLKEYSK